MNMMLALLFAAVPLPWTVETSRVQPASFDAYHGEALEFIASFNTLGKPLALDSHTATLYYQTNGMDQAWWSVPASVSGNVARATFTPAMDPCASKIVVFIGVSDGPSNLNYRAAANVRFLNSPGASPGWIEPPVVKLDFSQIETLNAPWFTKDESNGRFFTKTETNTEIASATNGLESAAHAAQTYQPVGQYLTSESDPTVSGAISTHNSSSSAHSDIRTALAGKQATISDLATIRTGAAAGATAVQPTAITDMETKTHAAATYQTKGSYLTSESDPTVSSWAKATVKPSYTWNEIGSKPTFAAVATSGAYSDLSGKPTIPTDATVAGWGYIKSWTETDPTVPAWAKATSKPSYTWAEITGKPGIVTTNGANVVDFQTWKLRGRVDDIVEMGDILFWNQMHPSVPYAGFWMLNGVAKQANFVPWTGVTGAPSIPTDSTVAGWGYIKSYTETDPTISAWAKATSKPSYTWSEIGSKPSWIGSSKPSYTWSEIGSKPSWIGSTKPSYTWSEIGSKPTFATVATSGAYSDLSGKPTIPTALPNPNAITIKTNGVAVATYDGSAARTVDLALGGGGGGSAGPTVAAATLEYHADGTAIEVTVAASGTFSATLTGWPDGQSQMAFVTLAAGASVSPSIKLIGYSEWPIGEEFMAVCTKRGNTIYLNPVCITEE